MKLTHFQVNGAVIKSRSLKKNKQTKKKATIGNFLSTDRKGFFSDFKHPAVMWALSQKCSSEQHLNPAVPRRKHRYRFLSLPPAFL